MMMMKKSLGESSANYLVWFDRALYENVFKFNTTLHNTNVSVPENVIFTGRKPTSSLKDVFCS